VTVRAKDKVFKFAFVTTVVALAGRKTQEKIDFLAEPTIAPLVLDAPFSALDPDYQSSVAQNLASQIDSARSCYCRQRLGARVVARALDPHVKKTLRTGLTRSWATRRQAIEDHDAQRQATGAQRVRSERDESVIEVNVMADHGNTSQVAGSFTGPQNIGYIVNMLKGLDATGPTQSRSHSTDTTPGPGAARCD
jgi:hypothetical protein